MEDDKKQPSEFSNWTWFLFSFKGRISRKPYWIFNLIVFIGGILLGLFTDGDLRRTLDKGLSVRNTKIQDQMTTKMTTIPSGLLAAEALKIIETKKSRLSASCKKAESKTSLDQRRMIMASPRTARKSAT